MRWGHATNLLIETKGVSQLAMHGVRKRDKYQAFARSLCHTNKYNFDCVKILIFYKQIDTGNESRRESSDTFRIYFLCGPFCDRSHKPNILYKARIPQKARGLWHNMLHLPYVLWQIRH